MVPRAENVAQDAKVLDVLGSQLLLGLGADQLRDRNLARLLERRRGRLARGAAVEGVDQEFLATLPEIEDSLKLLREAAREHLHQ